MIIASTDYDWRQAEERTLRECDECSNKQVQLDSKFASLKLIQNLLVIHLKLMKSTVTLAYIIYVFSIASQFVFNL